jgi:hypothetical protein
MLPVPVRFNQLDFNYPLKRLAGWRLIFIERKALATIFFALSPSLV